MRIFNVVLMLLASTCWYACSGAVGDEDPDGSPSPFESPSAPESPTPTGTPAPSGLVINEIAAGESPDWFEIYNGSSEVITLDDFYFTDDITGQPTRATFPTGTVLNPDEYYQQTVDATFPGFALAGDEELAVYTPGLILVDSVDWLEGDAPTGMSYGRFPDGTGSFMTLTTQTPGAENVSN